MSTSVIIKVSLWDSRTNPPKIKLVDSEGDHTDNGDMTSGVEPGAVVTWTADKASGIAAVTRILPTTNQSNNNNYVNLINWNACGRNANGDVYATILSPSVGKGKMEEYTIYFMIDGDPTEYSHDPKLKMNN